MRQAVRKTAATFAPRSSTKSKNPATKGTVLYTVFEVQAWLSIVAGFLLSYNLIFPSDRPDIARLLGMWSVWMLGKQAGSLYMSTELVAQFFILFSGTIKTTLFCCVAKN
jgi:hypothetical protein